MSKVSFKCKGWDPKTNTECPFKKDCYRFTRDPDKDQLYYRNLPYDGVKCDFYFPEWIINELKQRKN